MRLSIAILTATVSMGMSGCEQIPQHPAPPRDTVGTAASSVDLEKITRINTELAAAYYAAGQYATAAEVISLALAATPNNVPALTMAALTYAEQRDIPKAREFFDTAFRISPKDPDLNHNFGAFLCKNGDPSGSIAYFQTALQDPTYTRPANTLAAGANCLAQLGREDEAIQYFTGALRFDPAHPAALIGKADLQYRRGVWGEAQELMTRFARVAAPSAESLWLQVRIARKLGKSEDERLFAKDLRSAFGSSAQARSLDAGQFD